MSEQGVRTLETTDVETERPSRLEARIRAVIPGAKIVGVLVTGIAIGSLFGGEAEEPAIASTTAHADDGPIVVEMSNDLARRAGIRMAAVAPIAFSPELDLVGSVRFDESRVADIGGRVSGRITRLFVELGDHVEEGQAVAEIEGAELGAAVADYLSAQANLIAATRQAAREESLGRDQLTTATAIEDAHARAQAHGAEVRGAEQRLVAMGVSPNAVRSLDTSHGRSSRIVLRSPIAGEVVERNAVLGQVVDPTVSMLRIADLSQVWVQLDVFERDLARVSEGDPVTIVSHTYEDASFRGVVSHVDATLDERTRTARVRVAVPNEDRRLRPGQFVNASLSPRTGTRRAIAVPETAIFPIDGSPSVFVRHGNDYALRTVELGAAGDGNVEIRSGLRSGEHIVVAGGFALKSEMLR